MKIKTATVAACAGVVGRALVEQLTREGTRVVGFCRPGAESDLVELKRSSRGLLEIVGGDLATLSGSQGLVSSALEILDGRIDAHFHAAGKFEWVSWSDVTQESMESLWTANFQTAWALGREVFKAMKKHSGGSLMFVSNRDTQTLAAAGFGPYLATKAALNMFVQSLAAEGKASGIRVNAVLPTIIDTEVNRKAMPNQDPSDWVNPQRLASLMIQLSDPSSSDVSGALMPVHARLL